MAARVDYSKPPTDVPWPNELKPKRTLSDEQVRESVIQAAQSWVYGINGNPMQIAADIYAARAHCQCYPGPVASFMYQNFRLNSPTNLIGPEMIMGFWLMMIRQAGMKDMDGYRKDSTDLAIGVCVEDDTKAIIKTRWKTNLVGGTMYSQYMVRESILDPWKVLHGLLDISEVIPSELQEACAKATAEFNVPSRMPEYYESMKKGLLKDFRRFERAFNDDELESLHDIYDDNAVLHIELGPAAPVVKERLGMDDPIVLRGHDPIRDFWVAMKGYHGNTNEFRDDAESFFYMAMISNTQFCVACKWEIPGGVVGTINSQRRVRSSSKTQTKILSDYRTILSLMG